MKNKDISILIDCFRKLSANVTEIAELLSKVTAPKENETPKETPAKEYTFEEVRGILADKARAGYRAEVKALLASHGVKQLSEITDTNVLAAIVKKAEEFGND